MPSSWLVGKIEGQFEELLIIFDPDVVSKAFSGFDKLPVGSATLAAVILYLILLVLEYKLQLCAILA